MAKNDNLNDFLADVANAIRLKKGTSDLINPQDFSAEISSIEGGGSGIEYLDISGVDESGRVGYVAFGILAKIPNSGIFPPTLFALEGQVSGLMAVTAIAVDYDIEFILGGVNMNVEDLANDMGLDLSSLPRLTKEQFYSLE